ncbi:hypothetical protein ACHWQZ_G005960 [Mnemiopsis leidyi]
MPKQINVTISTVESDLDFAIQPNTLGKNLFDQICHTIGVKEVWYFGLQYVDNKGVTSWLRMNKKVKDQNLQKQYPWRFRFKVKLYPEDVSFNIIQDVTLRLFYLEIKELVISDEVYCPPETSVLLASYCCQEKFGDFDPEMYHTSLLDIDSLLPVRVIQQHRLTHSQWEEKIVDCWLEHKDQLREEAMLSFLKIAQDLDMYGVNYFEIYNRKGSKLWLGIDALGINIYHFNDKLAPQIGFPWSEINNISYSDKRFTIQTANKSPDFIFLTAKSRINKTILDLCIRNHELYIARRKPESPEVQQMKMQQIAERKERNDERMRLKKEREARIAAEHNQRVLEQKLMVIEQEQQASKKALLLYQAKSNELERKIHESEEQFRRLKSQREHVEKEMSQMEIQLNTHLEEKEELKEQYQSKEAFAMKTAIEVEQMQQKAEKLRQEYDNLQKKYSEEILSRSMTGSVNSENSDPLEDTCSDGQDFITEIEGNRSEENRDLETSRDTLLHKKLKDMEKDLMLEKNYGALTEADHQYLSIQQQGEDKYKTLKKIRKGNTRQRVEDYEEMTSYRDSPGEAERVS